jgi:ubiquinone/menaquinone biosynthesis C-methylase UbiE
MLHTGTRYAPGSRVLEVGCGTGAQTVILASHSPEAEFNSIDVSERSLAEAARRVQLAGCQNVRFLRGDIFHLPPALRLRITSSALRLRSRLRVFCSGTSQ